MSKPSSNQSKRNIRSPMEYGESTKLIPDLPTSIGFTFAPATPSKTASADIPATLENSDAELSGFKDTTERHSNAGSCKQLYIYYNQHENLYQYQSVARASSSGPNFLIELKITENSNNQRKVLYNSRQVVQERDRLLNEVQEISTRQLATMKSLLTKNLATGGKYVRKRSTN
ncbi:hypothetical protein DERF_011701 [Dermatophagoides farinae]|uniref:Uncharacterized protein n=1 Tax=Dermatophagoides farinae TaxID=6954 RepID=A0A922HVI6_DERFA|nr:hypothetical protein DERF_011701 [Dermatophagoides farinae]